MSLEQIPDTVRAFLLEKARALTFYMADKVRQNIESRLCKTYKSKEYSDSPRHLKDAVEVRIVEDGVRIDGKVYIEGIPYAKAQEQGATIPPHMIYPKKGKHRAFIAATGDKVFATRAFHPGGQIPPPRSEERRVGKEGVHTYIYRWRAEP